MNARQLLIAVRGLGEERERLAAVLAGALDGPVAHVRGDDLHHRWITRGLGHDRRDIEGVYRLLRLIVVSYLKDGYSVVVDAPFVIEIDGVVELRTRDLTDLMRLAATFRTIDTGIVTLQGMDGSRTMQAALADDHLDAEVRVVAALSGDDDRATRDILARLGM